MGKIMKGYLIFIFCFLSVSVSAQGTIIGNFPHLAGQQVILSGFNGFNTNAIDSTNVTEQGDFKINYTNADMGMGYLAAADNKPYFVVLANENIQLQGEVLSKPESILTMSGKENQLFVQFAVEHAKREQALSAWVYLKKRYQEDSLFFNQKLPQQAIATEMQRIKREDSGYLINLDSKSYISWYLPIRKLVSLVFTITQYGTHEIPTMLTDFRKMDYADERLYKSGLLKEAIDSHFWLLDNIGQPLDSVLKEMKLSIDFLFENLSKDDQKFNKITKYLFELLERQSLFQASEYLALTVLTQNSCTVNDDLAKQLEFYRVMKKGNTAPDIVFSGDVFKNGSQIKTLKRLSDIKSAYKVIVFGASWCPKCGEELSQLLPFYKKWKSKGVEVVFVSLDTDKTQFKNFSSIFPFFSVCDYNKWESQAIKDYYVFASPTLFLLDKDQKIILRPNSVKLMDAWVDDYLATGKN
jgi:thiol-disulfide isomerase/thioredoxin